MGGGGSWLYKAGGGEYNVGRKKGDFGMVETVKKGGAEVLLLLRHGVWAVLVGAVVGAAISLFVHLVGWVTAFRTGRGWVLFLLPVVGAVIPLLYKGLGILEDRGTNLVLLAVRSPEKPTLRGGAAVFLATVLTHLVGGSSGRTGASLQIGGSLAAAIAPRLSGDEAEHHLLMMCGMSGAFSALFGTPLAATVFAMEVVSVGVLYYSSLVPCTLAALTAKGVAGLLGVLPTVFPTPVLPGEGVVTILGALCLGGLCGGVSILYCGGVHGVGVLFRKWFKNPSLGGGVGGALVLLLLLLFGNDYGGSGAPVVARALLGEALPLAFLLKFAVTALTLGSGFKGGEIYPALFIGATFGCVVGPFLGLPAGFGAALGMVGLFCGVTNCPLTALLLGFEFFGGGGMGLLLCGVGVSYALSGYWGLYSAQRIVYGKNRGEYVNRGVR